MALISPEEFKKKKKGSLIPPTDFKKGNSSLISPEEFKKEKKGGLIPPAEFKKSSSSLISPEEFKAQRIEASKPKYSQEQLPPIDVMKSSLMQEVSAMPKQERATSPKIESESSIKSKAMDLLKKEGSHYLKMATNPLKFIDRAAESLVTAITPDAPMIKDGKNVPGTSARDLQIQRNDNYSTGNKIVDKTADLGGELGSYLFNPANPAAGPIAIYNSPAVQNIAQRLGNKLTSKLPNKGLTLDKAGTKVVDSLGGKAIQEGTKEALAAGAYAIPHSLIRGEDSAGEITRNVALETGLGAGLGSLAPLAGKVLSGLGNRLKGSIETPTSLSPAHPKDRVVHEVANPSDSSLIDYAGNAKARESFEGQYKDALEEQFNYLKESLADRQGVVQGTIIRDQTGDVVDRVGRISQNPKWYQEFHKEHGKVPNQTELRELARKQVNEGFQDESGFIPPWKPKQFRDIDDELKSIQNMVSENPSIKDSLTDVTSTLEKSRKELRPLLPDGVQAMSMQTSDGRPLLPRGDGSATKVTKRSDIVADLSKKLDIPVRVGKYRQRAHGIFKTHSEVVRTKLANDIPTIAHEVGHALDKRYQLSSSQFDNELLSLGQATSAPSYSRDQVRDEGVAEFFRMMLTDPAAAQKRAPRFFAKYEMTLPKDVKKVLTEARDQIQGYINQPITMKSISELSIGKKNKTKLPTLDDLYTHVVEELNPIKQSLKPLGKKTSQKIFDQFRMLRGSAGKAQVWLRTGVSDANFNKIGKSYDEIIKPVQKNLDEFRSYQKDKRAIELDKRGIMTGSDLTIAERKQSIRDLDSRYPHFRQAHEESKKYRDQLLDVLADEDLSGGIISHEDANRFRERNKEYVPFYRDMGDAKPGGLGSSSSPIKGIKGSDRPILDPIESDIKNTYMYLAMADRNKAYLDLVDAVTSKEGMGKLVEKIPSPMQGTKFTLNDISVVLEKAGANLDDLDMDAVANIFRPQTFAGKENVIMVSRNGKKEFYEVDPDLFVALNSGNREQLNMVTRAMQFPTQILRSGIVNTLEFWGKNLFRDQFEASIKSGVNYIPYVDMLRGFGHIMGNTDVYRKFMAGGAAQSFRQSLDHKYLQGDMRGMINRSIKDKTMNVIRHPIQAMQVLSELSEKSTRVGVFNKALKGSQNPEDIKQAASIARDVIDYSRKGKTGKHINRMAAFWNAQVQGIDKTIRVFKNPKTAPAALAKSVAYITTPTVGLYMAYKDDPRYQELAQWDKDLFWHFWVGDTHFRLPIPFELGVAFKVIPERLMSMSNKDDEPFRQLGKTSWDALNIVPWLDDISFLAPWMQAMANETWSGSPIVPRREQDDLPQDQAGPYTSTTAKAISHIPLVSDNYLTGDILGSPRKVDHLISGYGGSLGRYATQAIDKGLELTGATNPAPKPATGLEDKPLFKAVVGRTLGGSTDSIDKFYEKLDKLSGGSNSARKKNEVFDDAGELKYLQRIQGFMSDVSKEIREIQDDPDIDSKTKAEYIRELNLEMTNLARSALDKDQLEMSDFFPSRK